MARISGVDIPREKRLEISLTYIFGVGRTTARKLLARAGSAQGIWELGPGAWRECARRHARDCQ